MRVRLTCLAAVLLGLANVQPARAQSRAIDPARSTLEVLVSPE